MNSCITGYFICCLVSISVTTTVKSAPNYTSYAVERQIPDDEDKRLDPNVYSTLRMHLKLVRIEYSHLENILNIMHLYNRFFYLCIINLSFSLPGKIVFFFFFLSMINLFIYLNNIYLLKKNIYIYNQM